MTNMAKISGIQVFWMTYSFDVGMATLITITPAIIEAKQDAWISAIIASGISILTTFVATKLSLLHPQQTFIEYSQTILGKVLGKVIILPYFIQWYSVAGFIVRQSSDFLHIAMFHKTPLFVLIFTMLILMVYVTYQGGIESIGRCSEIFGPIVFLMIILSFILSFNQVHWGRLLPVYADSGWLSIFKGSVPMASFLGQGVIMMMITAFMAEPNKAPSYALWGVGIASAIVCGTTVIVITTFGPAVSGKMWFPYFEVTRFISIMDFIQNIDVLIVVVWILSVFIRASLYMFIASYGTAQLLGIKNWRNMIWFVALIILLCALLPANIDVASIDYPKKFVEPFVLPVLIIGIPLFLWMVGSIRKKQV